MKKLESKREANFIQIQISPCEVSTARTTVLCKYLVKDLLILNSETLSNIVITNYKKKLSFNLSFPEAFFANII